MAEMGKVPSRMSKKELTEFLIEQLLLLTKAEARVAHLEKWDEARVSNIHELHERANKAEARLDEAKELLLRIEAHKLPCTDTSGTYWKLPLPLMREIELFRLPNKAASCPDCGSTGKHTFACGANDTTTDKCVSAGCTQRVKPGVFLCPTHQYSRPGESPLEQEQASDD